MKAIWSYKYVNSDLFNHKYRWLLGLASVLSWRKFAPQVTREIYVDKQVKEVLANLGIEQYWHCIHVQDFNNNDTFWANPKAYAQSQQGTEPFWILDFDTCLYCPLSRWFDPQKYYALLHLNRLDRRYGMYIKGEDERFYNNLYSILPSLKALVDPTDMINGGMVYYANPAIGAMMGYALRGIQLEFNNVLEKGLEQFEVSQDCVWANHGPVVEEGALASMFRTLNIKLEDLSPFQQGGLLEHIWDKHGTLEDNKEKIQFLENLLDFDLMEVFSNFQFNQNLV